MQAKVTAPFDGARDGEMYPRHFNVGDVVDGNLAEVAVREKWAEELKPEATQPAGLVEIPAVWQELKAAELVKLARDLGASADVNTKAEAAAVIEAELERRANPPA